MTLTDANARWQGELPEKNFKKAVETENRSMVARSCGWWYGGLLMGMGFPFAVVKMFWNWMVFMVANMVNVPNTTELYT